MLLLVIVVSDGYEWYVINKCFYHYESIVL